MKISGRFTAHDVSGILQSLPEITSTHCCHRSFKDIFRSSRLASVHQRKDHREPSFHARHQQFYPVRQVISSFNSAHRRGEWGLKRPFPSVKDSNVIVSELDSQERQTPFTFATEKPRFVRKMRELGLVLGVPESDASGAHPRAYWRSEREVQRAKSPLEHFHPQWIRSTGVETGPRIVTLPSEEYDRYLEKVVGKRSQLENMKARLGVKDNQSEVVKELVRACLDLPSHKPTYQTHPTAGLVYSNKGSMPSTPSGTRHNVKPMVGKGRILAGKSSMGLYTQNALFYGIVVSVVHGPKFYKDLPDREDPVDLQVTSATVNPVGRLEIMVVSSTNVSGRDKR